MPFQLMIDLIGVCNMRPHCCMCVLDEVNPSVHPGLECDAFDNCDELLECCSFITDCSTGEVLIHPDLFVFLDLIRSKSTALGMTSNALALTPEMTDRLLPYSRSIYMLFSVDAASPETYGMLRGSNFDLVRSNISRFCRERRGLDPTPKTDVGVCFIPMRCNRHEIPTFFDLADELGVDYVLFTSLYSRPVNKTVTRDGFVFDYYNESLTFDELEECRFVALEHSRRTGIEFRCQFNTADENVSAEFKPDVLADVEAPCVMPWRYAKLVHNGETHPCLYIAESMGDWKNDPFESIWNCREWRQIRSELASGRLAEKCWHASSCPVVRCHRAHRDSISKIDGLVSRARTGRRFEFGVDDRDFDELVVTGFHPVENDPTAGEVFRWLGPSAVFHLPIQSSGEPVRVEIRGRCHKPDVRNNPVIVTVRVDGEIVSRVTLDEEGPVAIDFPIETALPRALIELKCIGCWRPSEISSMGSDDSRLLSFRVSKITIVGGPSTQS